MFDSWAQGWAVDPHPDPAQNFDADPDPDPGGGGRSAKNVHPPWQNPRYAPGRDTQKFQLYETKLSPTAGRFGF